MPLNDDRFAGGDNFAPDSLEHAVHLAMMANELNNGRGAYQISNAQLGASGPSYGPFQYDLGANDRARELFGQIAGAALDANGHRIISQEDLEAIRQDLYQPFSDIRNDPVAQGTYDRLVPSINNALSSDAGRRLIDDDYVAGLATKIESMNAVIAAVPDETNRAFLEQNRLAKLMILDTANQYGQAVNDGLHELLGMNADVVAMDMPGRRRDPEQIAVVGDLGIEDMIRYKLETQYGQTDAGARDVLRRISNLIDAAGPVNIPLSSEDREFLSSGLAQYLTDNGRSVDLTEQALSGLQRLASQTPQSAAFDAFSPVMPISADHLHDFESIFSVVSRDGRWGVEQSNNIAGGLLRNYIAEKTMTRIDAVVVGNPTQDGQTNIFAIHQPFGMAGPFFHTRVDADEAARTPLRDSLEQLNSEIARVEHQQDREISRADDAPAPQDTSPAR